MCVYAYMCSVTSSVSCIYYVLYIYVYMCM